ncbi:DUF254-domain-containing protein [Westerdykella ornata]|uniref:Vacuolar fusion protein MON1 n=1 Tax=Westerdykella ornata TaxID=318751 RepID=A0A6A6JTU2_WESOR|nr:DUF254-domain-containing protein [Westerdykella ornata]KAF2278429.1 DUF254-domain-containing protein [Westerdykella ornata]
MDHTGSAGPHPHSEAPDKARGGQASAPKGEDGVGEHVSNHTLSVIRSASQKSSSNNLTAVSREGTPPPLPPRPKTLSLLDSRPSSSHAGTPPRPQLVSKPTTQLSYSDTQFYSTESKYESSSSSASRRIRGRATSDVDTASVQSIMPGREQSEETESMLGEVIGEHQTLFQALGDRFQSQEVESLFPSDPEFEQAFKHEFDEIENIDARGTNEESVMRNWRSKLKHFLILSSAGKPIYSRHGNDELITNYMGVVQTIISFYQSKNDGLKSFTAGEVRFLVMTKGPLNLVAISRLPESDAQLRAQLDALYMQILSTLTLPSLERMFAARANYDLRRPLQGTEVLLSALADGFTRGSPSTLLGALECLRLRKSHRQAINNTFLKTRSENLLYGLIVASGKLVSVVRPKKHSLHPGDLHLIFNMLFEAGSVKAGGGENWIPLCLPGFNNTGYLYMYVSFLDLERPEEKMEERPRSSGGGEGDEVAILLISANKEAFYELRGMRDELVEQLQKNGSIAHIRQAVRKGRPKCIDIVPGSPLRHFLYKSRGNVQFTMPAWEPYFETPLDRRRLTNLYAKLHAQLHARPAPLKVLHESATTSMALAWSTPLFELYCVAPGNTGRAALAQAANMVVKWVRREEERVFIIGGAVF